MPYRPHHFILVSSLAALIGGAAPLAAEAQAGADPEMQAAESTMVACGAAAAARRHPDALAGAALAESAFRTRLARRPNDVRALVGLARTLGQCRIPSAELMQAGELSAESIELLLRALEVEPNHWVARYILALNYYRAPAFLGRSRDAAREFDRLIAQQGDRHDVPEYARPFEYRGTLFSRDGRSDSARVVWERGLRLFPADTALRNRLGAGAFSSTPTAPPPQGAQSSMSPPPQTHDSSSVAGRTEAVQPRETPATIETVRVTASRSVAASARATPSERVVGRSEVVTAAGAMADVLQAMQLQPGATRVSESAELYARGGDPAESPTFINGGRILSVGKFEGLNGSLFGALDPFVVRSARFSTGGFSVRHGNALSGLLDVETDGRPREVQWRAGLGLSQAGASVRVPLGDRSGAWASVRGTHAGALLDAHGRRGEFVGSPHSVEGMASFVTEPKLGQEVRVVGLAMRDASARIVDANGFSGPFESDGAVHALIISTQHLAPRAPLVIRTNMAVAERATDWSFGVLARERRERSAIGRGDLELAPSDAVTFRAGIEAGRVSRSEQGSVPTRPAVAPGSPVQQVDSDSSSWSAGSYGEAEWNIGAVRVLAGIRADRLPGERDITVDPRISLSTRRSAWTARLSAGQFHQGRWRPEASIPDGGTAAGLPREARHLVAGLQREGAISFNVEGFIKDYADYRAFGAGPQIVDGVARGVDVSVQRATGDRLTGWIGYSLLDAEVTLADGRSARSPFDVTHTATGSATVRLARGTTLGTSLRYGTGRPFTPVVGTREAPDGSAEPVYGAPSSGRIPSYARMDTRLMQYVPLRGAMLVGFVELLNVLDRGNVSGYVWDSAYRTRRPTHTFYAERTMVFGFEFRSR